MSESGAGRAAKRQTLADLAKLDELFGIEDAWTQEIQARDSDDAECEPGDKRAVCWCVLGGIGRVTRDREHRYERLERILAEAAGIAIGDDTSSDLIAWNDYPGRGFAELKQLIASARSKLLSSAGGAEK